MSTSKDIGTIDIECAVARHFDVRRNTIVPNVSWGLNIHECDLFIVSSAGYATEVEIKVSKADIKADLNKAHGHRSDLIKYLWFAIPSHLENCIDLIPERAGVLSLFREGPHKCVRVKALRKPAVNKTCRKLTDAEHLKAARLGTMRIFDLKDTIIGQMNSNDYLREEINKLEKAVTK